MAHGHHIIPKSTLYKVFGALVFLTVFTVLTAQIDLGAFNVPLALAIALTKALLVLTFFMALKYDNRVNTLVIFVGSIFVLVFLVFTLFDTEFRGDLDNVDATTIAEQDRLLKAQQERLEALQNAPGATLPAAVDTSATAAPTDTTAAAPADTSAAQQDE